MLGPVNVLRRADTSKYVEDVIIMNTAVPPPWRRSQRKVIVVLPAYDEGQNLGQLLERIDQAMADDGLMYEIIVVDDGSSDNTVAVARDHGQYMPILVETHEVNQGLGATIRDGLRLAAGRCADRDIVVAMDADNTHTPHLIRRMTRLIDEGCDVVIASRYREGASVRGLSFHRQLLSWGARIVFQLVFPMPVVRDYTCGYRAYRGAVLRSAFNRYGNDFVSEEGFQCMVDILLKMRDMDVIFGEVPLILRYDFKGGRSKLKIARTVYRTLALLVRRRLGWKTSAGVSRVSNASSGHT